MPHLRIEHSANLAPAPDWRPLFAELHALLHELASVEQANCKSRALAASHFLVGDAADASNEAFVHLDIQLFEGREAELLERIGRAALAALERACGAAAARQPLQLTVTMGELQRARYFKSSPGAR
jgi:5-carboxymethyl-2-hydroxymuconate isomerase